MRSEAERRHRSVYSPAAMSKSDDGIGLLNEGLFKTFFDDRRAFELHHYGGGGEVYSSRW